MYLFFLSIFFVRQITISIFSILYTLHFTYFTLPIRERTRGLPPLSYRPSLSHPPPPTPLSSLPRHPPSPTQKEKEKSNDTKHPAKANTPHNQPPPLPTQHLREYSARHTHEKQLACPQLPLPLLFVIFFSCSMKLLFLTALPLFCIHLPHLLWPPVSRCLKEFNALGDHKNTPPPKKRINKKLPSFFPSCSAGRKEGRREEVWKGEQSHRWQEAEGGFFLFFFPARNEEVTGR